MSLIIQGGIMETNTPELTKYFQAMQVPEIALAVYAIFEHVDQPLIILGRPSIATEKSRDNNKLAVLYCNQQALRIGIRPDEILDVTGIPENRYKRACFKVSGMKKYCDAKKIYLSNKNTVLKEFKDILCDDSGIWALFLRLKTRKEERGISFDTTRYNFNSILGRSSKVKNAIRIARQAAKSNANVLITGENGTGKELFAQAIHAASERKKNPFVPLNCGAIPKELIESELFGHEKGSFTGATQKRAGRFEIAEGGTLFLDEIGEMPLSMQVRLLRVLQEKQFYRIGGLKPVKADVRIIAATNRDLPQMVERGGFRIDLYYRVKVLELRVPALRDRTEDIQELAEFFLQKVSSSLEKPIALILPEVIEAMQEYDWPGNIRELENFIEAEVNLCDSATLSHIPDYMLDRIKELHLLSSHSELDDSMDVEESEKERSNQLLQMELSIADATRIAFESAFKKYHGNMSRVSNKLGISRATAYRRAKEYSLK